MAQRVAEAIDGKVIEILRYLIDNANVKGYVEGAELHREFFFLEEKIGMLKELGLITVKGPDSHLSRIEYRATKKARRLLGQYEQIAKLLGFEEMICIWQ
jgi:DNA-binding HxlR family transcriptional regulator